MKNTAHADSRQDGATLFSMYASSEIKKRGNQIDFSQVEEMLHMEANSLPESCQACLLVRGNSHQLHTQQRPAAPTLWH